MATGSGHDRHGRKRLGSPQSCASRQSGMTASKMPVFSREFRRVTPSIVRSRDDMYGQHFGLAELPFGVTSDPRFWHNNSLFREALATLRYGIETRKGFIVITGEAGTGKTTLLRRLMRNADSGVHTAYISSTRLGFIDLLRGTLNDLGIVNCAQDRLTLMAQLNEYLIEQLAKDDIVSLLVDEAQDLADETLGELRLLSDLETDKVKLIQVVLTGQPELERKLDQPNLRRLRQKVALRCRLAPLRSSEVSPYINSRLQTVGYQGEELFDLGAIEQVALYSTGIPRLINVICDNALLLAYETSQSKVSAGVIDEVARGLKLIEHHDDEPSRPEFEEFPTGFQPPWSRLGGKRTPAAVGVGIALAIVILVGTIFYSQQGGSLVALGTGARPNTPAHTQTGDNARRDDTREIIGPHLQLAASRPHEVLKYDPNGDHLDTQSGKESWRPQTPPPAVSAHGSNGETPIAASADSSSQTKPELNSNERASFSGVFRVFAGSFVRDKPRSDAVITAILKPGTRIEIVSKVGNYFRVRSLAKGLVIGYVHREDAFFEPAR
jgi:general secretion pathway protein A